MQISFNVFFLPFSPLSLSLFLPVYLVWCFVLLVAGFLFLLLLLLFWKIAFSFKCRTAKSLSAFPFAPKKTCWCLLWYFYKVPSFCWCCWFCFVFSCSASAAVDVDDGSAAGFGISVLGSGFWFGFLSVVWFQKLFFWFSTLWSWRSLFVSLFEGVLWMRFSLDFDEKVTR